MAFRQPDDYPQSFRTRNQWIRAGRGSRTLPRIERPVSMFLEQERNRHGALAEAATILLVNRECPWTCFMCDLWQNTLEGTVPAGAIPRQIQYALSHLEVPGSREARQSMQLKLYNSGSFFDPKAIPKEDDGSIAELVQDFDTVVVESHPRLIGERCFRWNDRLEPHLEVAMGLETVHPGSLEALNKGFGLSDFERASQRLGAGGVGLRVFLMVNPPFIPPADQEQWLHRSVDAALELGASTLSLIPTRYQGGRMKAMLHAGLVEATTLRQLEDGLDWAIHRTQRRVFADLWDLSALSQCSHCFGERRARLETMNTQQIVLDRVTCLHCHGE